MPDITNTFRDEKNKQINSPIFLYEITIDDETEYDIAEWDEDVVFGDPPKTYNRFPITHEGVPMNLSGEIDMIKVTVGNVSQIIGGFLLANNGLRGHKVVIKQVFANLLDDSDAYVDAEYWVDGVWKDITQMQINIGGVWKDLTS